MGDEPDYAGYWARAISLFATLVALTLVAATIGSLVVALLAMVWGHSPALAIAAALAAVGLLALSLYLAHE